MSGIDNLNETISALYSVSKYEPLQIAVNSPTLTNIVSNIIINITIDDLSYVFMNMPKKYDTCAYGFNYISTYTNTADYPIIKKEIDNIILNHGIITEIKGDTIIEFLQIMTEVDKKLTKEQLIFATKFVNMLKETKFKEKLSVKEVAKVS